MIEISKDEATYLRNKFADVHIIRTCKNKGGSRRGRRFVDESPRIIKALKKFPHVSILEGGRA